jgi:16S rRNA (cytosine967-C5)-methyltransferase
MSNPRFLAASLVNRVLLDKRSLTQALADGRAGAEARNLDARAASTAQALAYGTLRQAGTLRYYLSRLVGRPLEPGDLLGPLLVGLYELDGGDSPAYAVVHETVDLAARRHPRARNFVNAVLRNFQRRQKALRADARADPEARWNFPAWWLRRLRDEYPRDWEAIVTVQNSHPPMTLRVNRRRTTPESMLASLAEAGIPARQTGPWAVTLERPLPIAELPGFAAGLVSVQDLGAQWAAPLLDVGDGMRVLDACAAPGGKTGHLLELATLDLVALDSDAGRLDRVRQNLERLGLGATLLAADAADPGSWRDGRAFDRILLDAPCTASGVARRHPDGKWLKRAEDMQHLGEEQTRLLDALWPLLKPGGKMVYATCSLFNMENNAQVAAFLQRHPDARRETHDPPGAREGQLLPGPDTDGFFYARLHKT